MNKMILPNGLPVLTLRTWNFDKGVLECSSIYGNVLTSRMMAHLNEKPSAGDTHHFLELFEFLHELFRGQHVYVLFKILRDLVQVRLHPLLGPFFVEHIQTNQ